MVPIAHSLGKQAKGQRRIMETKEKGDAKEDLLRTKIDEKIPNDDSTTMASKKLRENASVKHRTICERCHRPLRVCICESLPDTPIALEKTELVILQHPHELKLKNRSVPILNHCLESANLHLCVGRRLGDEIDPKIIKLLQTPNIPILLFPGSDNHTNITNQNSNKLPPVLSLSQAKERMKEMLRGDVGMGEKSHSRKIVVLALDATWKYAREMHLANQKHNQYPSSMLQVCLQAEDFPEDFRPRRFEIRTTPGENQNWMSTTECVAWVLSQLESKPEIFSIIIKPLDEMVKIWNSFVKKSPTKEPPQKRQKR